MNKDGEGHGVLIHKDHYVTGAEFRTASSLKWESLSQATEKGIMFKIPLFHNSYELTSETLGEMNFAPQTVSQI